MPTKVRSFFILGGEEPNVCWEFCAVVIKQPFERTKKVKDEDEKK